MILSKKQITEMVQDPILLVDEVFEMEPGKHIKAKLYLSPEFAFFNGHFPGAPVLPGVIGVEAIAQTAKILLLSSDQYAGRHVHLIGMENVKFKKKILPKDTIYIDVTLSKEIHEKAVCICDGTIYNGQEEAATVAQIVLEIS